MKKEDERYQALLQLLKKELVPAMGCTEPIAIAYAAATAASRLQAPVEEVDIYASGNIIKNAKSVTVPHTNGRKGICTAAAIGIVAGDPSKELEVISHVSEEQLEELERFLERTTFHLHHEHSTCTLKIAVRLHGNGHCVFVCIQDEHCNIVRMEEDGVCVFAKETKDLQKETMDIFPKSVKEIYEFVQSVDLNDVENILEPQIRYHLTIAQEGLQNSYGANIGSVLLDTYGTSVQIRARALAAAGSDARMGGCELPVIINSGSGNQGMTCSLPVIAYAQEKQSSKEQLYRALLISNLTTLYQKSYIGRLSAYCGAVSAGAGAGAGIAYLLGGDYAHICHTIVNALAITSGMICDGAKPSCAAKIATAVDAGIMGCMMYQKGKQFYKGEGIVCCDIDETIRGVGHLAKDGMRATDDEIIRMMLANEEHRV